MHELPGERRKALPESFMRLRLFIDFWNFSLNWNEREKASCDWTQLPLRLRNEAEGILQTAGLGSLTLEETRVYASYEPERETKLKGWLHNFLDKQPGVRVFNVERHWKKHFQTKNFKVINATWRGHGHELAKICWASFELDALIPRLLR